MINPYLVLRDISYKSNFSFTLYNNPVYGWESHTLVIKAVVPDSRNPGNMTTVMKTLVIAPDAFESIEAFVSYMERQIQMFEMHESQEWFKFKGELVNDPHRIP